MQNLSLKNRGKNFKSRIIYTKNKIQAFNLPKPFFLNSFYTSISRRYNFNILDQPIIPQEPIIPEPPSNLSILNISAEGIIVSANPSESIDVVGYNSYYSLNGIDYNKHNIESDIVSGIIILPPDAPTNFSVTIEDQPDSSKNAVCIWDIVPDVDGYNIYLSDDAGFTYIKQNTNLIIGLTYTLINIQDGSYQAYITSVKNGLESSFSNIINFDVITITNIYSIYNNTNHYAYRNSFTGISDFTLEFWFNTLSIYGYDAQTRQCIIGQNYASNGYGFGVWINNGGIIQANIRSDSTVGNIILDSSTVISPNIWYHIAITYNKISGECILYVNGQSEAIGTLAGCTFETPAKFVLFTRSSQESLPASVPYTYKGYIDEARLWSIVRSESEINATKSISLSGTEPGLIAYWPCDEESGNIIYDKANNYDLDLLPNITFNTNIPF